MITGHNGHGHYNGHASGQELARPHAPSGPLAMPVEQSPLAMIDDRMRGRWKFAVPLGLVLGAALAVGGYRTAPVRFTSTGTIHVAPSGSPIMFQTPETGSLPRYDGVVATQAVLVKSPRVVEQALKDEKLAALPLAKLPDAGEIIMGNLTAGPVRGSELISVSYEDSSPERAQIVLNAVLDAFELLYGRELGEKRDVRVSALRNNLNQKTAEKNLKEQELRDFLARSKFGVRDFTQLIQTKILYIEQLSQTIDRYEIELGVLRNAAAQKPENASPMAPTATELDAFDPALPNLRADVRNAEIELENWKKRIINPNHTILIGCERRLSDAVDRLNAAERVAQEKYVKTGGVAALAAQFSGRSPEQLESDLQGLLEHRQKSQDELGTMQQEAGLLHQMELDCNRVREDAEGFKKQLEILEMEANAMFAGMVRIENHGQLPGRPSKDRRKQMAGMGFAAGVGMSLGLFFLLGSFDQRTYSVSQLRRGKHQYRCLGVLPDLGLAKAEVELSQTAVQCIHQIRNRIEALRNPLPSCMLVVTSPYQGDGKTSLSLALGWSYAAAGYRTLLMDCDLVGQGLSAQLGLRKRHGLREVLRDRMLGDHIVKLPVPNLHGLGTGLDASIGPESIRRDDFSTLADELRQKFDIIIADTGPFIGAIEVLPVASAADTVIFSIRRGRSRARLDDCFMDLANSNISALGVVLNCAMQSDCVRYVSDSVTSARHEVVVEVGTADQSSTETGENALVRAMASSGREHLRGREVVK